MFQSASLSEAGAAAKQMEERKQMFNDINPYLLRTGLEVCPIKSGDIWYMWKNRRPVFSQLFTVRAAQN